MTPLTSLGEDAISVVGDGWWSQRLQTVADALGVTDIVDFHGFVDEKTKHGVYASSWVLALPSLKEGWGIVVMEAATHGVPTVAYRSAGGVTESIVDGATGVLVDGDVVDFARALGSLLNDQPAIIRMGAAARERSEQFTWAATAEAFAEVLASATGQSTPHVSVAPAPSGHVEHHRPDDAWDQLSP